MDYIKEDFKRIKLALYSYEKNLQAIEAKCNSRLLKYEESIVSAESTLNQNRKELEQRIARTKAMLDIAKTHTSRHLKADGPIPYDHGVLSRLAVQISSGNPNDPFAEKLFTEASGQLMMLEDEQGRLMHNYYDAKKRASNELSARNNALKDEKKRLLEDVRRFLHSDDIAKLVEEIQSDEEIFGLFANEIPEDKYQKLSIGMYRDSVPICHGCEAAYQTAFGKYINMQTGDIAFPVVIDLSCGSSGIVKYRNENEASVLSGIKNFIINFGRMHSNGNPHVFFFDPVRYNASALGELSNLCGNDNSLIEKVPSSPEEIKKTLTSIVSELNQNELLGSDRHNQEYLIIAHNFPQGYDGNTISHIQQLCVNSNHFKINVLLTNNTSGSSIGSTDVINYIESFSYVISNDSYREASSKDTVPFKWFSFNGILPSDVVQRYIENRPIIDKSTVYEKRIGLPLTFDYHKGTRKLEDIPYGVDHSGNLKTISFEDSNFASFICGASRSGKSTLLHTLITGIIKNTHPDDVEMWLIDFKMTEFSRYTNHLPPHVRYIILDESPELVYDIINRLTEILQKRQNIFKGKWLKLDDVPSEKYMPAIIVIIDEFSVMSQIIADSIINSKDNYSIKLQTLLAKGAALGLHFIFASQGFTSGTRGLNDFSKKQIQQRIAMKTEFNEIRETLDLKSASDDDKAMMEQLPVHHTLTRMPVDNRGNHLQLSEVLYISDYDNQEKMIDSMYGSLIPMPKFYPRDNRAYIDKKTMIIDGNRYLPFYEKKEDIKTYLNSHKEIISDGDTGYLFLGEPRRMMPLFPVEISKGFCENILLLASHSEKMPATSIVLSIEKSLELQDIPMSIWTSKRDNIYKQYIGDCKGNPANVKKSLSSICDDIRGIKDAIEKRIESNQFILLLGVESIIMDMAFQNGKKPDDNTKSSHSNVLSELSVEKRKPGEMDLLSKLKFAESGAAAETTTNREIDANFGIDNSDNRNTSMILDPETTYDAREDLKYILTHGPNLGYHFIMAFNSAGEIKQCKTDISLFKHKILFRTSRQEAMEIIGSSGANTIAGMDDHTFRYTDGIDSVSFRPFLHNGLYWDGWRINESGDVDSFEDEEEYLL